MTIVERLDGNSGFAGFTEFCHRIARVEPERVRKGRFRWKAGKRTVGPIAMYRLQFDPVRLVRPAPEADAPAPSVMAMTLQLSGNSVLEQANRRIALGPGDFTLVQGALPYRLFFPARVSRLLALIPASLWTARTGQTASLGRVVRGQAGPGAVAVAYLTGLWDHAASLDERSAGYLAEIATDLLGRAAAEGPGTDLDAVTPREALRRRIRQYILARLDQPELTPARIAADNRIALRSLHDLFAGSGETVAGFIREARLSRCDAELIDPRLASRRISDIGFGWGFNDAAHFSRAYRRRFGVSPRQRRAEALREASRRAR